MPVEVVAVSGGLPKSGVKVMDVKKLKDKKLGSGPKTPRLETPTPRSKRATTPTSVTDAESLPDQSTLPSYMRQTAASMNKRRTEVQHFTSIRSLDRASHGEGGGRSTPFSTSIGGSSDISLSSEVLGGGIIPKGYEPGRTSPLTARASAPISSGKRSTTPQGKASPVSDRNGKSSPLPPVRTSTKSNPSVLSVNCKSEKNNQDIRTASKKSKSSVSEALVITDAVVDLDKTSPCAESMEPQEKAKNYSEVSPAVKKPSEQAAPKSMFEKIFFCIAPGRQSVNYD